jgi:hypothetical protein
MYKGKQHISAYSRIYVQVVVAVESIGHGPIIFYYRSMLSVDYCGYQAPSLKHTMSNDNSDNETIVVSKQWPGRLATRPKSIYRLRDGAFGCWWQEWQYRHFISAIR